MRISWTQDCAGIVPFAKTLSLKIQDPSVFKSSPVFPITLEFSSNF